MPSIPDGLEGSVAMQFVLSRGWAWKPASAPNIEIETCPFCKHDNYHLRMEVHGSADELKGRDGLFMCMRCGKSGRLADMKQHLGVTIPGVESRKDWSGSERKIEELPDIDACHQALLEDADAMDYLMNGRGFSRAIIEQTKLGIVPKRYFRECGEVKALVYPYLVNGNCVFVHYRSLPTMPLSENKVPKAFSSPTGWDVPIYNGEVLRDGLKEVFMVEGEPNTIAAMDHGVPNICGVPGANFKKADWIDTLDKLGLEKIYVCYDKDKVGQKAAQALAARIGIERCWKMVLPDFDVVTEAGEKRKGKDLNEWFTQGGGTAEGFEELKQSAELFDVDGVTGTKDAVQEFYEELMGKGVEPKYKSPWPDLNKLVGFDEGDIIDVIAAEKTGKTTWAMNLVEHMVDTYGEDGVIICLEMTRAKLARKWVCHKAQIADNIPNNSEEAAGLLKEFMDAMPAVQNLVANREGELYFCQPKYKTDEDLFNLIRQCVRRYGVKWIVVDNLQLWADTAVRGKRNRTEHLSEISKGLARIGKELNVQLVRILQPHRVGEGMVVSSDNTDGSSQIAKDCDCNISLHRAKVGSNKAEMVDMTIGSELAQALDDKTLTTVGLSRYSSGGRTWLIYDGARSTFNVFSTELAANIKKEMNKDVGYAAINAKLGIQPLQEAMSSGAFTI